MSEVITPVNGEFDCHSGYGIVHKSKTVEPKVLKTTGAGDCYVLCEIPTAANIVITGDMLAGIYKLYRNAVFERDVVVTAVEQPSGGIRFFMKDVMSHTNVNDRLNALEAIVAALTS